MRRLYLITFFVFLISSIIHSQWINQNPVPDGNTLWSVFFINNTTGWIVGSDGFIKKTTNAGIDWVEQNSGTATLLKVVKFTDENIGWVVGESGLIIKTTNGGIDWIIQSSGTTETLNSLEILNSNTLLAAGYGGILLKTTNGGTFWTTLSSGSSNNLFSISFVNETTGWAVGGLTDNDPPTIIKTTDCGINWIPQTTGTNMVLYSVDFVDEYTGFAVGTGPIIKTTDGGNSWCQSSDLPFNPKERKLNMNTEWIPAGYSPGYFNVFFKDANNGWIVGNPNWYDSKIFETTDAGITWERKYLAWEQRPFLSVFITQDGKGWAVGTGGVIGMKEDNNSDWSLLLSGHRDEIYSIHFVDENIGWAAAYRVEGNSPHAAVVLKTTNSGKIWKSQLVDYSDAPMISVYFINENFGWAVGDNTMYRTTDGGENWTEEFNFSNPTSSVFFINQDTGWVTKDNYSTGIYKSTNGGDTWVQKSSVSSTSINFSNINNGWAVGEFGSILKSTDGGETWVIKTSGTTNDLNCVKFYNSNLGMCVGNAGTVLISTDGGETWVSQNVGTAEALTSVGFTNSSTVWIAGSNGIILNTTDLGTNWTYYDGLTEQDLTSISFLNENTGWIGGANGTMFKYQNDVVPVELVSFTAYVRNNTVQLNWQTATEVNNYGFEIERRIDEEEWNNIGFVEGQGNSISPKSYSFADLSPLGGGKFLYRLKQLDTHGTFEYSNEIEVEIVPTVFDIYQNYPNPFNPSTKIRYKIPTESKVVIKIYDILGAEIITLLNEIKEPGVYEVELNAASLSSGTYIYRIVAGDPSTGSHNGQAGQSFVETKKMVFMK